VALDASDDGDVRYYVRQALQLHQIREDR